jgi:hypothetical protein
VLPKYFRLVRKEDRLSEAQFDALTDLACRLARRKPKGAGERITENTLIRVPSSSCWPRPAGGSRTGPPGATPGSAGWPAENYQPLTTEILEAFRARTALLAVVAV